MAKKTIQSVDSDLRQYAQIPVNDYAGLAGDVQSLSASLVDKTTDILNRGINVKLPFISGLAAAKGDGVTDDTSAIQAILNYAATNNLNVFIPNGIYMISQPLAIPSNVKIKGNGNNTILRAVANWVNGSGRSLIEILNASYIEMRDLFLDHNGSAMSNSQLLSCTMTLSNAFHNTFENIVFSDCGTPFDNVTLPGGPALNLVAKDVADDLSDGVIGGCSYNTFRNCRFELPKTAKCAFAVRLKTNWTKQRTISSFVNFCERNLFDNCVVKGDYMWNMIEHAGGGTRYNTTQNCRFEGQTLTAIDFDKGCNYNTAINNLIRNGGKPTFMKTYQPSERLAVINVHGFAGLYYSVGNEVLYNTIENINNADDNDSYSSMISTGYCQNSVITGNRMNSLNNKAYGAGILIDHYSESTVIKDNFINNCRSGILTNNASTTIKNLVVDNNDVNVDGSIISIAQGTPTNGAGNGVVIINNKGTTNSTTGDAVACTAGFPQAVINNNNIKGGYNAFNVSSLDAVLSNNFARNCVSTAFKLGANMALMTNRIYSTGGGVTYGANTITNFGNNFTV